MRSEEVRRFSNSLVIGSMRHTDRLPARSFEDLIVWQKARELVIMVYTLTDRFPAEERFGMTAQLRDAANSIPTNISEGFRRRSLAEKARFLNIAQASCDEVRNWLILARDRRYGDVDPVLRKQEEVARLLNSYRGTIVSRMGGKE